MVVVVNAENRRLFEADIVLMYSQRKAVFGTRRGAPARALLA